MLDWPGYINRTVRDSWFLSGNTPSVRGLDGRSQYMDFENRIWTNQVTMAGVWKNRIPQFRAFIHDLRGPSTVFRFPVCNTYAITANNTPEEIYEDMGAKPEDILAGELPFSDGDGFFNDAFLAEPKFALSEIGEPSVRASASAGATTVKLSGYIAEAADPGTFFTINDFLYEVAENKGGTVRINPPLREDVTAGVTAEFSNPYVRVRLASDQDARLFVDGYRFGQPVTFNIVEAFQR